MADEKQLRQAKSVYKTLCAMLDDKEWHYDKNEEELSISCGARGDDLPIPIHINVMPEKQLVTISSGMIFEVPQDRRVHMAVAVSVANETMVDGSFDFLSGNFGFRLTACYHESLIGKDLLEYMLMCTCITVDRYNDKFAAIAQNNMDLDEVVQFIKEVD